MIVLVLLLVISIGRRVADLLPTIIRDSIGFYISPLLGLAIIILIATMYGWFFVFDTTISISFYVIVLIVCIVFEKQRIDLFSDWLMICFFVIIATLPILAPAIQTNSFNPFNDSFTYLVHGQWLQEHSFSEAARSSGFYPAETQVVLYQRAGHRMGASFFLGFVQSLFNLKWSYYAYLAAVSLLFSLGSLAIGGFVRQVTPVSKLSSLVISILPASSMNGFVFGAQYGFFPQTFGLAFSAGLTCLIPCMINYTLDLKISLRRQFVIVIPLSIILSSFLITYSDMFPIVGAGIGLLLLLVLLQNWSKKKGIISFLLICIIQVLTFINFEVIRIVRNFINTVIGAASGAVHFGWVVPWSPIEFIAHSFGMKSPSTNNIYWIEHFISFYVFPFVLIAVLAIIAKILRQKPKNLTIQLLAIINLVFWVAFLKFRYATPGFEGEVGNTFLEFKISKWLAPFNLGLFGIAIAWILTRIKKSNKGFKYAFAAVLVLGLIIQYSIVAKMFTANFQNETMRAYSPFDLFIELRSRIENISKDEVFYLGIPNDHHKIAQMVAYILYDRKLSGKYEDGYLRGSLPENERDMPIEASNWVIQYKTTKTKNENPFERVGPFYIRDAKLSFFNLESINGAYTTETSKNKTWNWVKDSVEYRFENIGKSTKAKIKFQYLLSGPPRFLKINIDSFSGRHIESYKISMDGGWGEYESPIIKTNSEDISIKLSASGQPVQLSLSDSRKAKFLIQNICLSTESEL